MNAHSAVCEYMCKFIKVFIIVKDGQVKIRRISAASSASARLSKKVEAAVTPDPSEANGRYAPVGAVSAADWG